MSEIGLLYINILVDWSLSGIMTSKRVIRESESPRPAASSILISRMTRSSVIISYIMTKKLVISDLEHNRTEGRGIFCLMNVDVPLLPSVLNYGIMTEELVIREIRIDETSGRGDSDSRTTSNEVIKPFELQSTMKTLM